MPLFLEEKKSQNSPTNHLANERTFLAWIRTSIGIMALGFVVVKFNLFLRQIAAVLGEGQTLPKAKGYSVLMGIVLLVTGALTALISWLRFRQTRRQLNAGEYQSGSLFIDLLTLIILLVSVGMVIYVVQTTR